MLTKVDDLHYSLRSIDGYNKAFNFIISAREAGKTTAIWRKLYKTFKDTGQPSIVIRRQISDITEAYVDDCQKVINKFDEETLQFEYKKTFKEGVLDVKVKGKLFIRYIALSNPMSRIKSLMLRDIRFIVFDEFICNMKLGEKYLNEEGFKLKEIYNTFNRESRSGIVLYALGNPYSVYNPLFVEFKIDTNNLIDPNTHALKQGFIYTYQNCAVEIYKLKPELIEAIKKKNPLYQFDDSYSKYAGEGININDQNIPLGTKTDNYSLWNVFKIEGRYLAVWRDLTFTEDFNFFVDFINKDTVSARRKFYVFDFEEIVTKSVLLNNTDKQRFQSFANSLRIRDVLFRSIECYYLAEKIYMQL